MMATGEGDSLTRVVWMSQ